MISPGPGPVTGVLSPEVTRTGGLGAGPVGRHDVRPIAAYWVQLELDPCLKAVFPLAAFVLCGQGVGGDTCRALAGENWGGGGRGISSSSSSSPSPSSWWKVPRSGWVKEGVSSGALFRVTPNLDVPQSFSLA